MRLELVALPALIPLLLLRQDDHKSPENADNIVEQVQGVRNRIPIAHAILLHDGLRVVQDECGHGDKADVQLTLVDHRGAHEQVGQWEQRHVAEHTHQDAAQEQILTPFGH